MAIIGQISDIHAAHDNENLSRLKYGVDWLFRMRPDAVVLSGDLVDGVQPEIYRVMNNLLTGLGCPVFVLPGNADNQASMRREFADIMVWTELEAMHFVHVAESFCLIGVDTCLPDETGGEIRHHLPWLSRMLQRYGNQPTILFTHHHLIPSGIAAMDDVMCKGSEELSKLLTSGVREPVALCSGHVHRSISGSFCGIPAHICGSICKANPLLLRTTIEPPVADPPALMVHHIRNTGDVVSHHVALTSL